MMRLTNYRLPPIEVNISFRDMIRSMHYASPSFPQSSLYHIESSDNAIFKNIIPSPTKSTINPGAHTIAAEIPSAVTI